MRCRRQLGTRIDSTDARADQDHEGKQTASDRALYVFGAAPTDGWHQAAPFGATVSAQGAQRPSSGALANREIRISKSTPFLVPRKISSASSRKPTFRNRSR